LRFVKAAARSVPASLPKSSNSMAREKVILECTDCKSRNYFTTKNKRKHPERVETRKYCRRCNGHRVHKETK
jgi:large subunit ribosomal protein L33